MSEQRERTLHFRARSSAGKKRGTGGNDETTQCEDEANGQRQNAKTWLWKKGQSQKRSETEKVDPNNEQIHLFHHNFFSPVQREE